MALSVMDKIRQLDEEKSKLLDSAKREALEKAQAAISDLNALGFSYRLQEGDSGSIRSGGARRGAGRVNAERVCPICEFRTDPPHDARRHRGQDEKRPFTDDELAMLHMKRV